MKNILKIDVRDLSRGQFALFLAGFSLTVSLISTAVFMTLFDLFGVFKFHS